MSSSTRSPTTTKKTATAIELLEAGPVISSQVVNENVVILTRKYKFSLPDRPSSRYISARRL
jgi:predicted nucleic acid-binding protein